MNSLPFSAVISPCNGCVMPGICFTLDRLAFGFNYPKIIAVNSKSMF